MALKYYNVLRTVKPILDIKDIKEIKKSYAEYNENKLWNELQGIYVKICFIRKKSKPAILLKDLNECFKQITITLDANFITTQSPNFEESFNSHKEKGEGLYEVVGEREDGLILVLKNSAETKLFPKMQALDFYLTGKKNLFESPAPQFERDLRSKTK
ncbi:MAG: hypothetical protein NC131_14440 [Roseburia sp.]|nr:hypothetical protein [Roseburia sp.]